MEGLQIQCAALKVRGAKGAAPAALEHGQMHEPCEALTCASPPR
jgi:hypothetical protein